MQLEIQVESDFLHLYHNDTGYFYLLAHMDGWYFDQ